MEFKSILESHTFNTRVISYFGYDGYMILYVSADLYSLILLIKLINNLGNGGQLNRANHNNSWLNSELSHIRQS